MRRFVISELSMAPHLVPGDRFLTRRLRQPRRGRLIFFAHPNRPDFWLVKRIIGLPGETVSVADGKVHIDDHPIDDPWSEDETRPDGVWDVPTGRVFVLSDARNSTLADSRGLGPVEIVPAYVAMFRYRRGSAVGE